jgi:hypothetical protein
MQSHEIAGTKPIQVLCEFVDRFTRDRDHETRSLPLPVLTSFSN